MSYLTRLRIPVNENDHSRGPEDAPIVLVEYGDFQCPHCAQAVPIIERLRKALREELRFVFRHFPITSVHPDAMQAARAAEAAGMQGKFWEMHGLLFRNQAALDPRSLHGYAEGLGLDLRTWARDMEGEEVEEKIQADLQGGVRSGVNGTPTFFVNGIRYDGDWNYEPFRESLTATVQ